MGEPLTQKASRTGTKHSFFTGRIQIREYLDWEQEKRTAVIPESHPGRERWVYVFAVKPWGVLLRVEARIDGQDEYNRVDWETNTWIGENHRPPSRMVPDLSIGVQDDETEIYVILSRMQIPHSRLEQYIGNTDINPLGPLRVKRRGLKFDPEGAHVTRFVPTVGTYRVFLVEPLSIADRASANFAIACREYRKFVEERQVEYNLAKAALRMTDEVLKEDEDFLTDSKFDKEAALRLVGDYDVEQALLDTDREMAGGNLVFATMSPEYQEVLWDHEGDETLEDESIRIKALHTVNKMQSKSTRAQMERELNDVNSFVNKYLLSDNLFQSGRKFDTLIAEFGDILGEYGQVAVKLKGIQAFPIFLRTTILYRAGFDILEVKTTYPVGTLRVYHLDVKRMATSPALSGKLAGRASKLLVAVEAINLTMAWESFMQKKGSKELSDYAGPIGALCDLAGAVGKRVALMIERSERELALRAGKEVYQESAKLAVLNRVMAVIGIVGGICDMIEARAGALNAAKTLQYEKVIGYAAVYMGAAIGVHAGGMALAGASAGPLGWIAVGVVLLGLLVITWFDESDLATWLRNSQWGDRNTGKTPAQQLEALDELLARFAPKLKYLDLHYQGMGVYTSSKLEVTVQPGYVNAKSRFEVVVKGWRKEAQYDYEVVELDHRSFAVQIDEKGQVKPLTFVVDLNRPELHGKGIAHFYQRVRVEAQLDLNGDGKKMIPASGKPAWWWFFFKHTDKKFELSNSKFE